MERKGSGDETATNLIRITCKDDTDRISLEGPWSSSIVSVNCTQGVIVGIKTQVMPDQGSDDDTGLNNVEFYCKKNTKK